MRAFFEELDYAPTPIGTLSRRRDLRLGGDVFEILPGQDCLMISAFTASEVAPDRLGVAACAAGQGVLDRLRAAFPVASAEPVTLDNPPADKPFTQTVCLARAQGA
ncbi:MAG: hypothetical protein COW55_14990 [Rhodobacteraceae bacterium CG17_big_fil_post_rev_8_21_14_2_50_65_11]|nr:MAG: hypothetical protein COW55_14990 [Rhodobacteraceae bacterium CG17_big_fil_post_rev_8_21_14_2_50_65_11]